MLSQPLITVIHYINKILKKSSNKSFSKVNKKSSHLHKKVSNSFNGIFPITGDICFFTESNHSPFLLYLIDLN